MLEKLFLVHREGLAGAVRGVLGRGADVEESLQEAFLRAWRAWQGGFRPSDPSAWIFVVVMNTAKDLRRRRVLRVVAPLEEVSPVHTMHHAEPSAPLIAKERLQEARDAIHQLADHEREVFFLRVSAELSFETIARQLDIPVGTAKSRMRLALQHLNERLTKKNDTRSLRISS